MIKSTYHDKANKKILKTLLLNVEIIIQYLICKVQKTGAFFSLSAQTSWASLTPHSLHVNHSII